LPGHIHQRIRQTIAGLAYDPRPSTAKQMEDELSDHYRIRIENYRVIYTIDDEIILVEVIRVMKRTPKTYAGLPWKVEFDMSTNLQTVEELITQVEKLPPVSRLQLVQRVLHALMPTMVAEQPSILRFGEFSGDESQMSSEEDFAMQDSFITTRQTTG
jgi:mRNA interferase RelE/StbE